MQVGIDARHQIGSLRAARLPAARHVDDRGRDRHSGDEHRRRVVEPVAVVAVENIGTVDVQVHREAAARVEAATELPRAEHRIQPAVPGDVLRRGPDRGHVDGVADVIDRVADFRREVVVVLARDGFVGAAGRAVAVGQRVVDHRGEACRQATVPADLQGVVVGPAAAGLDVELGVAIAKLALNDADARSGIGRHAGHQIRNRALEQVGRFAANVRDRQNRLGRKRLLPRERVGADALRQDVVGAEDPRLIARRGIVGVPLRHELRPVQRIPDAARRQRLDDEVVGDRLGLIFSLARTIVESRASAEDGVAVQRLRRPREGRARADVALPRGIERFAGREQLPGVRVDVDAVVVRLMHRLEIVVAQTVVERQVGTRSPFVLDEDTIEVLQALPDASHPVVERAG